MKKTIIAFLLFLIHFSCTKEDNPGHNGIIMDYSGLLPGCGVIIQLDNGKILQVVANTSGKQLIIGKHVFVGYNSKPVFNICMVGETVQINVLRYL